MKNSLAKSNRNFASAVLSLLMLLTSICSPVMQTANAAWPTWRGPNRDGQSQLKAPAAWPATLDTSWSLTVGTGHSSPVSDGKFIYQHARSDDQETVYCLTLEGKIVWKKQYAAPYKMHNAARNHGKGPKSTPTIAQGKLLTQGISGIVSCWNAADGELLWQHEYAKDYKQTSPLYGTAASPLVVGDHCFVHVGMDNQGALVAYELSSGKEVWRWEEDGPGYGSPILTTWAGSKHIVTQSQTSNLGISLTGDVVWKSEYKTQYTQNSITPLVVKDRLISSGYKQPLVAYARTAAVIDEAWVNKDVNLYMSTPVASKGKLICFSQRNRGQLCQVDAQTGETDWLGPPRQGDNGALIAGQDFVFCQNTNGELIVISPNSDTYKELARYKISNSPTWAHPAIVGSTLLIKNLDTLSAIQLH